jgi:hypothetical protein
MEGFATGDRSLAIDGEKYRASTHALFPCTTCHADATAVPHAENLQPVGLDTCATCHADAVAIHRASVHGTTPAAGTGGVPGCADCHGEVHALAPADDAASPAHWSRLARTCARCHADVEVTERFQIPVVRPVEAYLASAHARAVEQGARGAVCSDCHGAHDVFAGTDPRASIWRTNIPATRRGARARRARRAGVHRLPWRAPYPRPRRARLAGLRRQRSR